MIGTGRIESAFLALLDGFSSTETAYQYRISAERSIQTDGVLLATEVTT